MMGWSLIIRYRKIIIVFTLLLTLVLGYSASQLTINSDFTSYLPESDPAVSTLNYISKQYSGKHIALIAIATDEIFSKETLESIQYLTNQFKQIDGISYVTSLTNIIDIKKVGDDLEISQLIDETNIPHSQTELQELKKYVLSKELYRGRIVSEDSKVALIICRIREGSDDIQIAREIKSIIHSSNISGRVYCAGYSFNLLEVSKVIVDDLRTLLFFSLLIIICVLYVSYRSFYGVVLPLVSVLLSIVWTLGCMHIMNFQISLVTNVIPIILIAVGSAYCIHLLSKYREQSKNEQNRMHTIQKALTEVSQPIFFATITTIVGFLSFIFGSYLSVIKEFGILSALGIFFSFINTITFIPAVLSFLPHGNTTSSLRKNRKSPRWSSAVSLVVPTAISTIAKHRIIILVVTSILCITCIFSITKLQRSVDMTKYFKEGTDIRVASEMMRQKFNGDMPVYFIVRGDIMNPRVLTEMKKLQEFIRTQKNIFKPYSIIDLIEEMNDVLGEGRTIPDTKEKIGNLWFLLEGNETVSQMVNSDKTEAIIQATMPNVESPSEMEELDKHIHEFISKSIDTSIVTITVTGMPLINIHMDQAIVQSQLQSLSIALIFVFFCMVFLQRSFLGGILGIIPIVITLLIIFGCMGFMGIPLNLATVLVGSISIGIGIDYPIHFMNRFRREYSLTFDKIGSLATTLSTTGKAITINVITVMMGFLVLIFSNLVPLQNLGILIGITMLSSGLATLTLLPTIIITMTDGILTKTNYQHNGVGHET